MEEGDNHEEKGLVTLYSRSQALGGRRGKDDPGTGDREEALLRARFDYFCSTDHPQLFPNSSSVRFSCGLR